MNIGFDLMATNLGMAFPDILLLVVCLGSLMFFAKDFKLGAILLFLSSALIFALDYKLGLNGDKALIVIFLSLIIMAFSLYAIEETKTTTGGMV